MECDLSHQAVNMALWCNFLVFSLKFGVWISTSSHVMLAEMIHSIADFANQVTLSFTVALYMLMPFFSFLFHSQTNNTRAIHQISGPSCVWFEKFKTCSGCNTPVCIDSYFGMHSLSTNKKELSIPYLFVLGKFIPFMEESHSFPFFLK
jgi:hypothetical protein